MSSVIASELLLSLMLLLFLSFAQANGLVMENGTIVEMVPLIEPGKTMEMMMMNDSRRRLGSFQICAPCTCCGGVKNYCVPSPCCYAINCNIPNRPFGFCSFTPKSCNCFGCHLQIVLIIYCFLGVGISGAKIIVTGWDKLQVLVLCVHLRIVEFVFVGIHQG